MISKSYTKELLLHALLSGVILLLMFPHAATRGHVIVPGYQLLEAAPWKTYAKEYEVGPERYQPAAEDLAQWINWYTIAKHGWAAGEWPLWNPYQSVGVPLLANYQTAFFNPVRLPYALFDVGTGATVSILLKIYLCGLTAYIYARAIGLRIGIAYVLSTAWMLSTLNLSWVYWCSSDVAIWIPIQLLGIDSLAESRNRRGFVLIAMSATLILFSGHPESAFTTGLAAGIYFLARIATLRLRRAEMFALMGHALGAWLLALLITTPQTLPFIEYLSHSATLGQRDVTGTTPFISAHALMAAWVPRYFGVTYSQAENVWRPELINSSFTLVLYPGMLVWYGLFALPALKGRLAKHSRHLLGLGTILFLYVPILTCAPGTEFLDAVPFLRIVWRFWFLPAVMFALVAMGSIALDAWCSSQPKLRQLAIPILSTCAVALMVAAYHRSIGGPALETLRPHALPTVERELLWALAVALMGLVIIALPVLRMRPQYVAAIFAAFLSGDLFAVTHDIFPTCERKILQASTKTTDLLRSRYFDGRVKTSAVRDDGIETAVHVGFLPPFGIEEMQAYDGVVPRRFGQFSSDWLFTDHGARLLSVNYRLVPRGKPTDVPQARAHEQTLVSSEEGLDVYEDSGALPRARLVTAAVVGRSPDDALRILRDPQFNPAVTALVEHPIAGIHALPSTDSPGDANIISRTLNSVVIDVVATDHAILVLSDQYFPGWNAYIDGVRAPVFPVYALLRGVKVEPGTHAVVFRYEPVPFAVGMWISTTCLLACCALTLKYSRPRVVRTTNSMRVAIAQIDRAVRPTAFSTVEDTRVRQQRAATAPAKRSTA